MGRWEGSEELEKERKGRCRRVNGKCYDNEIYELKK